MATNNEFTPEKVRGTNESAASLCQWVIAMDKYSVVQAEIQPKI